MAKTIHTLVEDIYGLFTDDFMPRREDIESFGRNLATHLSKRIGEGRGSVSGYLRLSNIGTPCDRKLHYIVNSSHTAEAISPQTRLKFLMGDIIEELLLFLAAQAGHEVTNEQEEVEINGVKGHIDAVIDGVVVDTKSAASQSFKKFENHTLTEDDPFGYIDQINSYRYAKGGRESAFLVMDKQLGKLTLDIHPSNDVDYDVKVDEKKSVVSGPLPDRPYTDRPDGKSGNMKLGTICSYCAFKHTCWADANDGKGLRTFLYSTGPRYLTQVVRQPDVVEIDQQNNLIEREYEYG